MPILFISDLHLAPSNPEITALFLHFLRTEARKARELYILGDLFDLWLGDDNKDELYKTITKALAECSNHGVSIYIMAGNRDFFLGRDFAMAAKSHLITEPKVIMLYSKRVLLLHGDLLCTDDKKYQLFRKIVRSNIIQKIFLALPLAWRHSLAQQIQRSTKKIGANSFQQNPAITDVTQQAVANALKLNCVKLMIHGHTHLPGIHDNRIVLGAWTKTQGSVLVCEPGVENLIQIHI